MRYLYIICFGFFLFSAESALSSGFMDGFEDIPLMDGLTQMTGNDVVFGNEEASYIETQAKALGKETFADVAKFYQATLPQLGWKIDFQTDSNIVFYRENEVLEIAKVQVFPLKISIILKNRN